VRSMGFIIQPLCCVILAFVTSDGRAGSTTQPDVGANPPGFSLTRTGDIHDFNYLIGAWETKQKRLKVRGVGSSEWIESPANQHCALSYLGGLDIVEDSWSPTRTPSGLFLYTFNPQKQQWAIRWVNPKTGEPDPPNLGGFTGKRGEFYGEDVDNDRPIKVRITWTKLDDNHARWEQAFSYDNRTWETNWVTDFTRADPATLCRRP
jgi:hypothetical protein